MALRGEDGGVGADPERERENGDEGDGLLTSRRSAYVILPYCSIPTSTGTPKERTPSPRCSF